MWDIGKWLGSCWPKWGTFHSKLHYLCLAVCIHCPSIRNKLIMQNTFKFRQTLSIFSQTSFFLLYLLLMFTSVFLKYEYPIFVVCDYVLKNLPYLGFCIYQLGAVSTCGTHLDLKFRRARFLWWWATVALIQLLNDE